MVALSAELETNRLLVLAQDLLAECRALSGLGFAPDDCFKLQAALAHFAVASMGIGLEELSVAAKAIELFISDPLTQTMAIDERQNVFSDRIEALRSAQNKIQVGFVTAAPVVALLALGLDLPATVSALFLERGIDMRRFDNTDGLINVLRTEEVAVVLVGSESIAEACQCLDILTRQPDAGIRSVLIGVGSFDSTSRAQALIGGVEVIVERLDDPALIVQCVALVERSREDPYRVLIVDDDASTRRLLRVVLEQSGMAVHECANPGNAMSEISRFQPDLLLLDLYMPDMDGMSFTLNLRKQSGLVVLPIVVISGEENEQARFLAVRAGADDYLTKPIRPRLLVAAVRSRIRRARQIKRQLPVNSDTTLRTGQLRRGDFLAQLGLALKAPATSWQVLLSVRLDQAQTLSAQLGHAGSFELEQIVLKRLANVLRDDDAYTLWLEFGFGILVLRENSNDIIELANQLCKTVSGESFLIQGQPCKLTASVGVALPPGGNDAGDPDRWFGAAHAAQSIAHRHGGDRFDGVLSREYSQMPAERVMIIREWAATAVSGENVVIEFQPLLSLRGDTGGTYALQAKLRDYRAPLSGITRAEYLGMARDAGALPMIDRMSLFNAFEAITEEHCHGRNTRVLVSMDIASFDNTHWRWFEAEQRRRKMNVGDLIIEIEASSLLACPDFSSILQRLKQAGVTLCLSDQSGDLDQIGFWLQSTVDMLRLPYRLLATVTPAKFRESLSPWRIAGRTVIVDNVDSIDSIAQLWEMKIDFLQGNVLAASSPRLDYEFSQFGS